MTYRKYSNYDDEDTYTRIDRESASQACVVPDQSFYFKVVGLKPNTYHNFFVNEVEETSRCQQTNKTLGAGLTTDANGVVTFRWYRQKAASNTTFEHTSYTDKLESSNKIGSTSKSFQLKMLANGSPTVSYALGVLPVELEPVPDAAPADTTVLQVPIYANSLYPPGDPYYDAHPDWQLVPVIGWH